VIIVRISDALTFISYSSVYALYYTLRFRFFPAMVFVYDYHPASETLLNKHFTSTELNGYTDPFSSDPNAPRPYSHTKNTILRQQHSSMLPESVIWSYIIQLTAAFRVIHAAG